MGFRTEPKSIEEMLEWGMINKFVYERVLHFKDFNQAKEYIDFHYGFNTWLFGASHIEEYLKEHDIDISDFNVKDFTAYCIKLANGRMNPSTPKRVYSMLKFKGML